MADFAYHYGLGASWESLQPPGRAYKRALAATLPPSLVTDASGESGANLGHGTYNKTP